MKGLNRMLFVVFFAIGIVTGWSTITNNSVSASPTTLPTVYLERPSIPLSKFAINVDLENQKATIEGNANVNVNVTTTEKVITKYKYKTIKELVYRPVYIQKFNAPVKPEIDSCMLPGHIAPLAYVVSK